MLIIEKEVLSNGAHRNQTYFGASAPEGWIEIDEQYYDLLPFISVIENKDGTYTIVDNPDAREACKPPIKTPSELRREVYQSRACVLFDGDNLTIDQANEKYLGYLSEGKTDVCQSIQALIVEQKNKIREEYPDAV